MKSIEVIKLHEKNNNSVGTFVRTFLLTRLSICSFYISSYMYFWLFTGMGVGSVCLNSRPIYV